MDSPDIAWHKFSCLPIQFSLVHIYTINSGIGCKFNVIREYIYYKTIISLWIFFCNQLFQCCYQLFLLLLLLLLLFFFYSSLMSSFLSYFYYLFRLCHTPSSSLSHVFIVFSLDLVQGLCRCRYHLPIPGLSSPSFTFIFFHFFVLPHVILVLVFPVVLFFFPFLLLVFVIVNLLLLFVLFPLPCLPPPCLPLPLAQTKTAGTIG